MNHGILWLRFHIISYNMSTFTYNSTRLQPGFSADRLQAERLAGEEDDRSDIELMDDDDEKNEAEESDPLTLTDLDAGRISGISMVFGSGQAVKMRAFQIND